MEGGEFLEVSAGLPMAYTTAQALLAHTMAYVPATQDTLSPL